MKAYKITYDVRDGDHEYVQHLFFSAGDELTEEVRMFGHQLFLEEAVPDGTLLLDDGSGWWSIRDGRAYQLYSIEPFQTMVLPNPDGHNHRFALVCLW